MEEASIHKWLLLLQLPSLTYFRHRFKMGISLEKVLSVVLSLLNSESGKQPYWSAYEGDRKLREGEFIVQICYKASDVPNADFREAYPKTSCSCSSLFSRGSIFIDDKGLEYLNCLVSQMRLMPWTSRKTS